MKKEEMRVGNYVFNQLKLNWKKITEIRAEKCSIYYLRSDTGTYHTSMVDYNVLVPIPLTSDLLINLGAYKLDKSFPSYNLFGLQVNYIDGLWIEYISRVEITGLHHLQNIFYFRMSEELKINEI